MHWHFLYENLNKLKLSRNIKRGDIEHRHFWSNFDKCWDIYRYVGIFINLYLNYKCLNIKATIVILNITFSATIGIVVLKSMVQSFFFFDWCNVTFIVISLLLFDVMFCYNTILYVFRSSFLVYQIQLFFFFSYNVRKLKAPGLKIAQCSTYCTKRSRQKRHFFDKKKKNGINLN